MSVPKIEPISIKEYTVKQSEYEGVGKLPIRSVILGPSGSGKTVLLQNMILDIYRNCFSKIYIFSPSIHVDASWSPVKEYIEKHMKVTHTDEEPIYMDHYDPDVLADIIDTQHKITDYMKKQNQKHLFQILVIVDDFADDPSFSRRSKLLHSLFTRGRHNSIHPIIRINATSLFVYRLRNYKDLESFIEEVSAVIDKKTLLELYNTATSEPYSFLYVNLVAKSKNDMFYIRFDKKMILDA